MNRLSTKDVEKYVANNIQSFHTKRLEGLEIDDIKKLLKRKNPYLFKVKNIDNANDVVRGILDAHISSSEETKFGDWLEGLAIYICGKVYGGQKSSSEGIDLEFSKDGVRYLVNIKSGPNWANSSQINKMVESFKAAKKTLSTSGAKVNVEFINGCCYGKSGNSLLKGYYYKYCGQKFWEFISGDRDLYTKLIEPLGKKAKERNEEFMDKYNALLNKLTRQFIDEFCDEQGKIDWNKIVKLNSADGRGITYNKDSV